MSATQPYNHIRQI